MMDEKNVVSHFLHYLRVFWNRKGLIAATAFLGVVLALLVTTSSPAVYESYGTLLVQSSVTIRGADLETPFIMTGVPEPVDVSYLNDMVLMVESRPVVMDALRSLTGENELDEKALQESYASLQKSISVRRIPGSHVLEIRARDQTPEMARRKAAKVIGEFLARFERGDALQPTFDAADAEYLTYLQENLRPMVLEEPFLPVEPVSPRPLFNLIFGLVIGAGAGLILAVLQEIVSSLRSSSPSPKSA